MLGKIFALLCLSSTVCALFTGRMEALSAAILSGAGGAVTLTLGLLGLMCLWCGMIKVFSGAGFLGRLSRLLAPLLRFAFPGVYKTGEGAEEICATLAANLLGMGNAATPFALCAMQKMKASMPAEGVVGDDMITFAVLNTAAFSLIPSGLIALRYAAGSAAPAAIILPVFLVSLPSSLFALLLCRLFARLFPYKA